MVEIKTKAKATTKVKNKNKTKQKLINSKNNRLNETVVFLESPIYRLR